MANSKPRVIQQNETLKRTMQPVKSTPVDYSVFQKSPEERVKTLNAKREWKRQQKLQPVFIDDTDVG